MPELLIKIGEGSKYEDGDIMGAFNKRKIRCIHAQHICHPWKSGLNRDGLRPIGTVAEDFYRHTHKFKFQRVSHTEVRRTNLKTMESDILSGIPNNKKEHMNVHEFIQRRLSQKAPDGGPKAPIFGVPGNEIWYGGNKNYSESVLDSVWSDIESKTLNRERDFTEWPFTQIELKHFLVLPMTNFTDDRADALVSPILDETDPEDIKIIKKRRHKINWRDILSAIDISPILESDILDRSKIIDFRGTIPSFLDTEIAIRKD